MRTEKRWLPIWAVMLRRGRERTQFVMEPQENARNIPASAIGCQGKNVGSWKKEALYKTSLRRASFTVYDAPAQMGWPRLQVSCNYFCGSCVLRGLSSGCVGGGTEDFAGVTAF